MNDEIDPAAFKRICEMAEHLQELTRASLALVKPQVDAAIRSRITDEKHIERLLDQLLDLAGMSDEGLVLFKRLCRYYYPINPVLTAEYVIIYRNLYDSDHEDESCEQADGI